MQRSSSEKESKRQRMTEMVVESRTIASMFAYEDLLGKSGAIWYDPYTMSAMSSVFGDN